MRRKNLVRRRLLTAAGALAVVFAIITGSVTVGYLNLQHNIRSADLLQPGQTKPAVNAALANSNVNDGPMNILVLGTDTRAGADSSFGSVNDSGGYGNSDVIILVHISADRRNADVVSIPRDTMAPYPGCVDPATGTVSPPAAAQIINGALQLGGPSCAVKTIEAATGITIDHFLVADFNAVVDLTNTLGGVQVCVNAPINDPLSTLNLPQGNSLVQGQQALAFLRTRHGFGDGSDLGRIKAQQEFLASMVRKIKTEGTLTDIPKMYSIADTVTKNLTVDKALASIPALLDMANRLRNIEPQNVTFITAPNEPYILDHNRVQLQAQASRQLFHAINTDTNLTAAMNPPSSAPPTAAGPATPAQPTSNSTVASTNPAATSTLPAGVTGQTGAQSTCQSAYTG